MPGVVRPVPDRRWRQRRPRLPAILEFRFDELSVQIRGRLEGDAEWEAEVRRSGVPLFSASFYVKDWEGLIEAVGSACRDPHFQAMTWQNLQMLIDALQRAPGPASAPIAASPGPWSETRHSRES